MPPGQCTSPHPSKSDSKVAKAFFSSQLIATLIDAPWFRLSRNQSKSPSLARAQHAILIHFDSDSFCTAWILLSHCGLKPPRAKLSAMITIAIMLPIESPAGPKMNQNIAWCCYSTSHAALKEFKDNIMSLKAASRHLFRGDCWCLHSLLQELDIENNTQWVCILHIG